MQADIFCVCVSLSIPKSHYQPGETLMWDRNSRAWALSCGWGRGMCWEKKRISDLCQILTAITFIKIAVPQSSLGR